MEVGGVSSGEFPVGMSLGEGVVQVGGGIVRLDPNPSGLSAARPQDKLTCSFGHLKMLLGF